VLTLDDIQRIKKPSKLAFDACRLLCLFINTFRDKDHQWPKESFQGWVTVHHYLIGSPNIARVVKEILQCKKFFIRPFNSRMNPQICDELNLLRTEFLGNLTDHQTIRQYSGHKNLKAIVTLVLTSLNQITPEFLRY
jgi:hypothetical protein